MIPMIKAPYRPTIGSNPATNANATASGTNASATVSPDSISFLGFSVRDLIQVFIVSLCSKSGQR
jgi:hypothetical protein